MSDYLLPEVVTEILSRLPVKSLLRFRCVCKSWNSLITSPNFIKIQLNQSKSRKNHQKLLLTRYMSSKSQKEQFSLRLDNADFAEYDAFKSPTECKRAYFRVVGVCNGLICLSDDLFGYSLYTVIIWNPAIRRFLELPKPSVNFDSCGPNMYVVGFGFDEQKNECKVVRLAYLQGKAENMVLEATPLVEVYAVSTGSWRTIKRGVPSYRVVHFLSTQVFFNGSVHWAAYKSVGIGTLSNVVMSFDMAEEKFGIIEFPKHCADWFPVHFCIGLYRDLLALFVYDNPIECAGFEVHVMKEYGVADSWSKLLRVEIKEGIRTLLCFREDGEVLVVTRDNALVSVEPNSKRIKNLGISGYMGSLYAAAYEESLALLNGLSGDMTSQLKSYESQVASKESSAKENKLYGKYIADHVTEHCMLAVASVPGFPFPS